MHDSTGEPNALGPPAGPAVDGIDLPAPPAGAATAALLADWPDYGPSDSDADDGDFNPGAGDNSDEEDDDKGEDGAVAPDPDGGEAAMPEPAVFANDAIPAEVAAAAGPMDVDRKWEEEDDDEEEWTMSDSDEARRDPRRPCPRRPDSDGEDRPIAWHCVNCTDGNPEEATVCRSCQTDRSYTAESALTPSPSPPRPPGPVVVAYDARTLLHRENRREPHPERPDRLVAILARLAAAGVLARCERLPAREATPPELLAVHAPELVDAVAKCTAPAVVITPPVVTAVVNGGEATVDLGTHDPTRPPPAAPLPDAHPPESLGNTAIDFLGDEGTPPAIPASEAAVAAAVAAAAAAAVAFDPDPSPPRPSYFTVDTYTNEHTALAARLAAGMAADVAAAVASGRASAGLALVRPPGHHAEGCAAMGFCMHNNIAVAVRSAQAAGAHRVMIVDWDVHHGNGTEHIFAEDPSVLFISLHRHQGGRFYPGTGRHTDVGRGAGQGFTVNVPWETGGVGDGDYLHAFWRLVVPIGLEFRPDIVLVSAGFDAAAGDPLGGCNLSPEGYGHLTAALRPLAPVAVVLEGGYNLRSISLSAEAVARVLLGETPAALTSPPQPTYTAASVVAATVGVHAKYWRCLSQLVAPGVLGAMAANDKYRRAGGGGEHDDDDGDGGGGGGESGGGGKGPNDGWAGAVGGGGGLDGGMELAHGDGFDDDPWYGAHAHAGTEELALRAAIAASLVDASAIDSRQAAAEAAEEDALHEALLSRRRSVLRRAVWGPRLLVRLPSWRYGRKRLLAMSMRRSVRGLLHL